MRLQGFCIGLGGLLAAACSTPAVTSRPATVAMPCTTERDCPVAYYNLPRTYLTVTVSAEKPAEGGAATAAVAATAAETAACTALEAAQAAELTAWVGALNARLEMVREARQEAQSPSSVNESLRQAIERLVTEILTIDAALKASTLRARNYDAFCLPQVTLTLAQSVLFDGARYALFGAHDGLSNDTITLTLGAGGLTGATIGADDQSEGVVTGLANLITIPNRLRAMTALDRADDAGAFKALDRLTTLSDSDVTPQLARILAELADALEARLSYPPSRLAPLPRLANASQMPLVDGEVVGIWPGLWARADCVRPAPVAAGRNESVGGLMVGVPMACRLNVLDQPGGEALWSQAFLAFDGQTAAPLGVMRTRFTNRTSAYTFADGHLTGSTITAPSPATSIFGLPFKIIENIIGGVKKGLTDEKDLVEARESLAAAETARLEAEATLRAQQAQAAAGATGDGQRADPER